MVMVMSVERVSNSMWPYHINYKWEIIDNETFSWHLKYEIEKVSIHIDQLYSLYSRKYPDFEVFRSYPQNDIRRAGRLINFNQYVTEFLKKFQIMVSEKKWIIRDPWTVTSREHSRMIMNIFLSLNLRQR